MDDDHELARQDMVRARQRAGVTVPDVFSRQSIYPTAEELEGMTVELHHPVGVDDVGVIVWDASRILARTALHSHTPWEEAAARIRDLVEEAKAKRRREAGA